MEILADVRTAVPGQRLLFVAVSPARTQVFPPRYQCISESPRDWAKWQRDEAIRQANERATSTKFTVAYQ